MFGCRFAHYDTGRIADPPRFIDNTASIKKTGPSKSRDSIPDGMSVKLQKAVLDLSRREERISRKEHDLEDRERRLSAHEMELRGRQSIDEQGLAARSLDMDEKEMCIAQLQQDTSDAAAAMKDRESALRRKENNQGTMHPDRAALNNLQAANQAFSEELDVRHSLIEARELAQRISEQRHAKAPVEVEIVVKLLDVRRALVYSSKANLTDHPDLRTDQKGGNKCTPHSPPSSWRDHIRWSPSHRRAPHFYCR